jgi:hypothetical protein
MIDTQIETLFPLWRGSREIQSRPSAATLWRWAMRGVRGVKLDTVIIGGRRYTSHEAFARFTADLNPPLGTSPVSEDSKRAKEKALAAKRASTTFP